MSMKTNYPFIKSKTKDSDDFDYTQTTVATVHRIFDNLNCFQPIQWPLSKAEVQAYITSQLTTGVLIAFVHSSFSQYGH